MKPAVSHYNWERIRGMAQIHMGTEKVRAEELPFYQQLRKVTEMAPYHEMIAEIEESGPMVHAGWGDSGVLVVIRPSGRDRHHRPEVPEELVEEVEEVTGAEYPNIPVGSLAFDRQLELLLDRAEEWGDLIDCVLVNEQEGQMVGMTGREVVK